MQIKIGLVAVAFVATLFFPIKVSEQAKQSGLPEVLGLTETSEFDQTIRPTPEFINVAQAPDLTARSVLAFDAHSGSILYAENFDEAVAIASLTKLMTALVAIDHLKLDKIILVNGQDINVIGNSMGLEPEEQITVKNLLFGMLIVSGNDAAKVLAAATSGTEEKFVALMNAKAKALNLKQTYFSNATGLDGLGGQEGFSTAQDLARVVKEFLKNPLLAEIVQVRATQVASVDQNTVHYLTTTNKLLLENENVLGIKTGFTSIAKGNLIARVRQGRGEIISIVLGSDDRETDSKLLINWLFTVYKW